MSDEMSPEATRALRSALGHLESQAPEPPQLPVGAPIPAPRLWSKPAVVAVAFALAALVALPGLWWLRSDDDAIGPDSSTTSGATPTSTTAPGTTAASTSTVATLPPVGPGLVFQRVPDPTGAFVSGTLVETAPSQGGDTVMGTSGVAVVALTDSPEGLVAVGYEHIGLRSVAAVWISDDGGLTWERIPPDAAVFGDTDHPIGAAIYSGLSMDAVAYGQGRFVALGTDTSVAPGPVAWFSDDGRTWTRVLAPDGPQAGSGTATVEGLVAVGNGFVAVGVDSRSSGDPMAVSTLVWTSPDGATWQTSTEGFDPATSRVVTDLAVIDGSLIAVGYSLDPAPAGAWETAAAWVSSDGVTWVPADVIDPTGDVTPYTHMQRVIATPTGGIAIGWTIASQSGNAASDIAIWTTTDGVTWTRVSTSDLNDDRYKFPGPIVEGPAGIVGIVRIDVQVSDDGLSREVTHALLIWTSGDGLTWEETSAGISGRINDLAVVAGRYIAVGTGPGVVEVPGEPDWVFWDGAVWIAEIE
jgi:hypothetical protein